VNDWSREQLFELVANLEKALKDRYDFSPATPLNDNPVFLYLATQGLRGRVATGQAGGPEHLMMRAGGAMFGMGCWDSMVSRLKDSFFADVLAVGHNGPLISEGLQGYLLIDSSDLPNSRAWLALWKTRLLILCLGFCWAPFILWPLFTSLAQLGLTFLIDSFLLWLNISNIGRLGALLLGGILIWLLGRPMMRRLALPTAQWTVLLTILFQSRTRARYLENYPIIWRALAYFIYYIQFKCVFAPYVHKLAIAETVILRIIFGFLGIFISLIFFWGIAHIDPNGPIWMALVWAIMAGGLAWLWTAGLVDLHFNRRIDLPAILDMAVESWRAEASERLLDA
jgi:hypothetical protein